MPRTTTEPAVEQTVETRTPTVAQIVDAIRADTVELEAAQVQEYLDESTVPFGGE